MTHNIGTPTGAVSSAASAVGLSGTITNMFAVPSSFACELEKLRSVSQPPSEVGAASAASSQKPARSVVDQDHPPSWSAESGRYQIGGSTASGNQDTTTTDQQVEPLFEGAIQPAFPPPATAAPALEESPRRRTRSQENKARRKVVSQMSSLLFPWWECNTPRHMDSTVYHLRTRLEANRVGLLIDPGAHANLVGERTAQQMLKQAGMRAKISKLSRRLSVEGVGAQAQSADVQWEIPICVQDEGGGLSRSTFTAPVIAGSDLPPLLGLKSLRAMKALIDTDNKRLILPGKGEVKIILPPNSHVYELQLSDSGHLILPVDCFPEQSHA